MRIIGSLTNYFIEEFNDLDCSEPTKAYIVSIFSKYKFSNDDLSNKSLTIEYSLAKFNNDFNKFQQLGDWVFFTNSLYPEHLNNASEEYYYSIGRLSFYSCYRLLNKSWKAYEEIADNFIDLSEDIRNKKINYQ